ncbi:MAG TPA: secretin and TonB N-terminal domain-containing protein [Tepidisphaeraceae bacterium]
MSKWNKAAGLLFLSVSSVYSGQALGAGVEKPVSAVDRPATDVKLLNEAINAADPFAAGGAATTGSPTTKPSTDGHSVSASEVNVSDAGTVEIHVNDANLVEVLRMLSMQSQKNIIASKAVNGSVTANLYDVTVREALDAILHSNGYAYREKGNFIYVYTAAELAEMDKASRVMKTEVFHLYYTPAANAANMVKPVLSNGAQVALTTPATAGLTSGTSDTGGNNQATDDLIVITDYPENLEQVRKLLKDIDHRPQQILIEATILRAALTEDNSLGVDFTLLGGVDFKGLSTAGSSAGDVLSGNITNTAPGLAERGVAGANTGFTQGTANGGLRVGLISNNIAMFVSALEQVTDTVVLANPKVLALNKQKGEVIVGRKDGYITTEVTQSSSVQTVEFLDTGTRLIFRPFVGDDGFIRMEIHPEDSSGGLNGSNLPFKVTTEVTSNVMVKDGHTIVIGGLFREDQATARGQVPLLGNIPLAGALFRKQRDTTVREEVIILLTPHIVKDDAAYSAASEAELKDAQKLRVGVRQGMMPFGRERLAESSYEKAVAEMNKPNPNRRAALWYLNCATNLNPKFIEAINMKQALTGREVTSVDNSTIHDFVRRQILAEKLAGPTTMPLNEMKTLPTTRTVAEAPATQPVANNPTTQPTAAAMTKENEPVARTEAPAPAVAVAAAPVPATQPLRMDLWSVFDMFKGGVSSPAQVKPFEKMAENKSEAVTVVELPQQKAATTRPAQQDADVTITELPIEELDGSPATPEKK